MQDQPITTLDELVLKAIEGILLHDDYLSQGERYSMMISGNVILSISESGVAEFSFGIVITPEERVLNNRKPDHAHFAINITVKARRFACPDQLN